MHLARPTHGIEIETEIENGTVIAMSEIHKAPFGERTIVLIGSGATIEASCSTGIVHMLPESAQPPLCADGETQKRVSVLTLVANKILLQRTFQLTLVEELQCAVAVVATGIGAVVEPLLALTVIVSAIFSRTAVVQEKVGVIESSNEADPSPLMSIEQIVLSSVENTTDRLIEILVTEIMMHGKEIHLLVAAAQETVLHPREHCLLSVKTVHISSTMIRRGSR